MALDQVMDEVGDKRMEGEALGGGSNGASDSGSGSDSDSDSGSGNGSEEEVGGKDGKRKAEDFLHRAQRAMDLRFTPKLTLPGDDVTEITTRTTRNLRLGAGLIQRGESILATRAGMLRYRPPGTYWVESNGRRYVARAEDQVLGIVEDRMGDSYKVNIFGSSSALLGMLEFDGASKRSKPNLKNGALVFCRVAAADKDLETELTCTSTHHGSKKEWMTGQSTFGEIKGGSSSRCSLLLARSLTKPDCQVLTSLGKRLPFEIAVGLNGAFWVDSGSEETTIVIINAILNSEVMTDAQTEVMVERLVSSLNKPGDRLGM
ncbi:unnamed protein product [Choristocarpus tenellus]